jgi:hypothetical protein
VSIGRARHGERETVYDRLAALLAVVFAGIHVSLGVTGDEQQFLVVAGFFVVGVLFFSRRTGTRYSTCSRRCTSPRSGSSGRSAGWRIER